jgi:hypothetical protein
LSGPGSAWAWWMTTGYVRPLMKRIGALSKWIEGYFQSSDAIPNIIKARQRPDSPVEKAGKLFRVNRGAHDDQLQFSHLEPPIRRRTCCHRLLLVPATLPISIHILLAAPPTPTQSPRQIPPLCLNPLQTPQQEIRVQRPFVGLVDDDDVVAEEQAGSFVRRRRRGRGRLAIGTGTRRRPRTGPGRRSRPRRSSRFQRILVIPAFPFGRRRGRGVVGQFSVRGSSSNS